MLGCELALAGVASVILDGQPGPSDEPKANGPAGQVIRLLDMRGLYYAFGDAEGPPEALREWIFAGLSLKLSKIENNPMHAPDDSAAKLVGLLEKKARDVGVDVRWGHAVTGLSQRVDGVTIDVSGPGDDYELDAAILVGADGGRSLIRKAMQIDFLGSTSNSVTRIADVHLPDALRSTDGGYVPPGFGRLQYRHNWLDRGGYLFFQTPSGRTMFGTV